MIFPGNHKPFGLAEGVLRDERPNHEGPSKSHIRVSHLRYGRPPKSFQQRVYKFSFAQLKGRDKQMFRSLLSYDSGQR